MNHFWAYLSLMMLFIGCSDVQAQPHIYLNPILGVSTYTGRISPAWRGKRNAIIKPGLDSDVVFGASIEYHDGKSHRLGLSLSRHPIGVSYSVAYPEPSLALLPQRRMHFTSWDPAPIVSVYFVKSEGVLSWGQIRHEGALANQVYRKKYFLLTKLEWLAGMIFLPFVPKSFDHSSENNKDFGAGDAFLQKIEGTRHGMGVSLQIGFALQFFQRDRDRLRLEFLFNQGLRDIMRADLTYSFVYDNTIVTTYQARLYSRGTAFSVRASYPIVLKRQRGS